MPLLALYLFQVQSFGDTYGSSADKRYLEFLLILIIVSNYSLMNDTFWDVAFP